MVSPAIPDYRSIVNRKELEEVYDLLDVAFPVGRQFFQQRLDHDSTYDPATTWIASVNGTIASTVQIFPFRSRVEDESVFVAGIGSVATHPDFRGQGHSQLLLKKLTEWMDEQGYDLSLLFAVITPFYEKAGWSVVTEPLYDLNSSGVPGDISGEYEIVPFDPSYTEAMAAIYEQFNQSRTLTAIRPAAYWKDHLQWPNWKSTLCLLAIKNGVLAAYGTIRSTQEGKAYLEELCCLKGQEEAAIPLFQALALRRPDAENFLAKLPDDHPLAAAFTDWGATRDTYPYAMWKVIRLQPLLAKLTPVFARRLSERPDFLQLDVKWSISCAGQSAYFHCAEGKVEIEPEPRPNVDYDELKWSQEQFISMLFQGIGDFPDAQAHEELLGTLFPRQSSVFYLTDQF